jgi:hypothetical protein
MVGGHGRSFPPGLDSPKDAGLNPEAIGKTTISIQQEIHYAS